MCAHYGVDGFEGVASRRASGSSVRFVSIGAATATVDESRDDALMLAWARDQHGHARITGSRARNLNPLIHEGKGARRADLGWWGLHVGGAPAPFSAFNSRDDKLLISWREPFQRRALLPATWYTEKGRDLGLRDGDLFTLAAIVTPVVLGDGGQFLSYSMVTREAIGEAADAHHRMPLVVPQSMRDEWLALSRAGDEALVRDMLRASDDISRAMRSFETAPAASQAAPRSGQADPTLF